MSSGRWIGRAARAFGMLGVIGTAITGATCASPPGELVVVVQTDMGLPKDIDTIRMEVYSDGVLKYAQDFDRLGTTDATIRLPATMGLLVPEDPSAAVTIQASARRGGRDGEVRIFREVVTTIPEDRVALLHIRLGWLCEGQAKDEGGHAAGTCANESDTCAAGLCQSPKVDSRKLPDYADQLVFGGLGPGEGSCFDVGYCFENNLPLVLDDATRADFEDGYQGGERCAFSFPNTQINVGLRTSANDGICGPAGCFIALNVDDPEGWHVGDDGRIELPPAVCLQLVATPPKITEVVAAGILPCHQKRLELPTCGEWSSTGPTGSATLPRAIEQMRGGHAGAAAEVLSDGTVLVVGGFASISGVIAGAERYDPSQDLWANTGEPPAAERAVFAAAPLPGGSVLVTGGDAIGTSERYNLASDAWATPVETMQARRAAHTATLLTGAGEVLAVGGTSVDVTPGLIGGTGNIPSLQSAERYTPGSPGTWTAVGNLNTARYGHTATALPGDVVLIAGGVDDTGVATTSVERFSADVFTTRQAMSAARTFHTATLLDDGRILVAGGRDAGEVNIAEAEIYDPAANAWTPAARMNVERAFHTATLLDDGRVLVTGGISLEDFPEATAELYDPAADTWTITSPLTVGRAGHTATRLLDGRVLIAGGTNGFVALPSAEIYECPAGEACKGETPTRPDEAPPADGTGTASGGVQGAAPDEASFRGGGCALGGAPEPVRGGAGILLLWLAALMGRRGASRRSSWRT